MKVLFIVHDVYQEDNQFPLGIAYLASVLRNNGDDVEIYCMDIFHFSNKQLADHLDKNEYDMIGLGFMSARFMTILSLCKIVNEHKKKARFVLGGPGPSATPEYILGKTDVDAIAVGEAEKMILDIHDGVNRSTPVENLDSLPLPAWDLFPMDKYTTCMHVPDMSNTDKFFTIISSRGCCNKCSFCFRMEKGLRLRSIPNVINEIKILNKKYGVNYFLFADEFFALSKKRIEDFKHGLEENNLNIKYWCSSRVKGVDSEVLQLMKDSGCRLINYGFESMDADVLKEMNKNTTPEDNENAAMLTKEAGIPFGLNFIWGFSNDTADTLWKNVDFIKKYNPYGQLRTIRVVTPYPGSPLYYDAIKKGLLESPDDFYNRFKNSDLITVNFTGISDRKCYDLLYTTNRELILDHQKNSDMSFIEAANIINAFKNLYYNQNYVFRGARHYVKVA